MLESLDRSTTEALDGFITELLAALDFESPPVDAFAAADLLGLRVFSDRSQSARARLARLKASPTAIARPVVFLADEPRAERRHWAVAHEIGEFFAAELLHRVDFDPRKSQQSREGVANEFARRFLLPSEWFADAGASTGWDLFDLKQTFATASHELIGQRMLDFPQPLIVTVFDHGHLTWRRSNLGYRPPRLSRVEQECQQLANSEGQVICRQRADVAVRAWPVHEPDWKREILRTEIQSDF